MASAKEFRDYADECKKWAKCAKTNRERDIFLQLAKSWMDAALLARDRKVPHPSAPMTKPLSDQDDRASA
jgi:hypothetical protein